MIKFIKMINEITIAEYFLTDALGSVRQLTNTTADITSTQAYSPYETSLSTAGDSETPYGFTGEYTDATGNIYLRARYYNPNDGRFISRDTWAGDVNNPLSLNRWNYTQSNPINYTDPSGMFPIQCQSMPNKSLYELCVLSSYGLKPISYSELGLTVKGEKGCYSGPTEYRAPGYLEGFGDWMLIGRGGHEVVYDFATMERQNFIYLGVGINDAIDSGGGVSVYVGKVTGFRTDTALAPQYRDWSGSVQIGASLDLGVGVGGGGGIFWSWSDFNLRGGVIFVGGSLSGDFLEGVDIDISPVLHYWPDGVTRVSYAFNGEVRKADLINDIMTGKNSPAQLFGSPFLAPMPSRMVTVFSALRYIEAYEELRNDNSE